MNFQILLVVLGQLVLQTWPCNSENITFLSYFPCTDLAEGNASHFVETCDLLTYVAARVAVDEINSREDILNGSFVNLVPFATRKAGTVGLTIDNEAVIFHSAAYLNELGTVHGVIGPGDPDVIEKIAPLASNHSNTVQILYEVADSNYPFLFSTLPSVEFVNEARLSLLLRFKWIKVATLASSEKAYQQAHENFNQLYSRAIHPDLTAVVTTSFVDSPDSALQEIQRSGTKIILGFFGPSAARKVLCRANFFGLTTSEHVWLLPSYYSPGWWQLEEGALSTLPDSERCCNKEMEDILESTLFFGAIKFSLLQEVSTAQFHSKLIAKTKEQFPGLKNVNFSRLLLTSRARRAYEAVWLLALAWNSSNIYQDKMALRTALSESVWMTKFYEWCETYSQCFVGGDEKDSQVCLMEEESVVFVNGVSDSSTQSLFSNYYGQVLVSQFVGGDHCPIGFFWPSIKLNSSISSENVLEFVELSDLGDHDCLGPRLQLDAVNFTIPGCPMSFTWKDGSDRPPTGDFSLVVSYISVSKLSFVGILTLCCFTYAITLLIFSFVFRKNRHIKASSPKLNVVIIIGYMMHIPTPLLIGLVLSGLEYDLSLTQMTIFCQLSDWMITIAPILIFGTLLVKNWRLYQIFYNKQLRRTAVKGSTDEKLIVGVLFLAVPVVILLIIKTIVDTLHAVATEPLRTSQDINNFNFINITFCYSEYMPIWDGLTSGYNLLMMVSLMFFAFQNSRISAHGLKDFKAEGIASYRVLILLLFLSALLLIVRLIFLFDNPLKYERLFWQQVTVSFLPPTLYVAVISFPKFLVVYQDHRKELKQKRWRRLSVVQEEKFKYLESEVQELQKELTMKEKRISLLKGSKCKQDFNNSAGRESTV